MTAHSEPGRVGDPKGINKDLLQEKYEGKIPEKFEDQLDDLLDRWESYLDQGIEKSPLQLAGEDFPYLGELSNRMNRLRGLRWIRSSSQNPEAHYWAKGDEPVPGFRLDQPLGRGGFGEVWRATDPKGDFVAIKFVSWTEKLAESEWNALQAIKEIRHPNLISIVGVWRTEKALVVAMELADSCMWTCWQQERRAGRLALPDTTVREWFAQAAQGIDALHKVGFDHRDIKPSNLLIVNGVVKVADFGLAKIRERSLATHSSALSIAYAAPEYFDGKSAKSSDQYCLAVTYCQMRGGELPFDGTPAKTVAGHLRGKPNLSRIPPDERPALAKALSKEPKDRWGSCGQFVTNIGKPVRETKLTRRNMMIGGLMAAPVLGYVGYRIGYPKASSEIEILNQTSLPQGFDLVRMIRIGFFHPEKTGRLEDGLGKEFFVGIAGNNGVLILRLDTLEVVRKVVLGGSACMAFHPLEVPVFFCADNDGGTMEYILKNDKPNKVFKKNLLDINDIALTFDSSTLYLASCDSNIYKYNLLTQELVSTLSGNRGIVYSLGLPFSAKRMFSGGLDGQVILWNLITGKKISEYDHHDTIVNMIIPLNAIYRAVSISRDKKVLLLDYEDGKVVSVIAKMKDGIGGASFFPGDRIGVSSNSNIFVYESDGKEIVCAKLPKYKIACFADVVNVAGNTEMQKKYSGEIVLVTSDNLILHCKMPSY